MFVGGCKVPEHPVTESRHSDLFGPLKAGSLDSSRLAALLESAQLLHTSVDLEDLLRHLLRTVMARMLAGRGMIAVEEDGVMRVALARGMHRLTAGSRFDEAVAHAEGIEFLFWIGPSDKPAGVLGVSHHRDMEIEPAELDFIKALLGIAAGGINKARAHAETGRINGILGHKVQDLKALLDVARGFSSCTETAQVARLLGLTLAGRWAVRRYAVAAWREGCAPTLKQKGIALPATRELQEQLGDVREAVSVAELSPGSLKQNLQSQQAELIFPLRVQDKVAGCVVLGRRSGPSSFSQSDLEFGISAAAQAAVALERAWYFRETLEKQRMEEELALAASIQAQLFPQVLPELAGWELAARNRPARQCGGDYYDVLPIGRQREQPDYLFCMADVSGKGLPAALLMSNLQAILRTSLAYSPPLVELASRTSALLLASTPPDKYVTAILAVVDPATGVCSFVNAGHNGGILLHSDSRPEILQSTGAPLGLIAGIPYTSETIELKPGDTLVLYSDGVPEAFDLNEEEWGEEQLIQSLQECRELNAVGTIARVFERMDAHVGAAPPHDDITLLVISRRG